MNRLIAIIALSLAAIWTTASAQSVGDAVRTARVTFDEKRAVKITAVVGYPVVVELDGADRVEDLVQSEPEADGWEIGPKGHRLVMLALKGAKPKSLTAFTKARTYLLEVVAVPASPEALNRRVARIVIEPPPAPKAPAPAAATPPPPAPIAATEPLSAPRDAVKRNGEYSLQVVSETIDIRPREVFDDGRFTYFRFPGNLEVPAIYRSVPDAKDEWLVNSHREGDFIVMQAVSPLWTLRLAGSVLGIFNDAFNAEGIAARDGTTTNALKRELRK